MAIKYPSTLVRHALTVLALMGLAVVARIRNAMLDFNSLLTGYLADDAFYYFKIAANIATQHRITYDGEQLSNGFHPLWMILIVPFYTPLNDGIDFVYRVQWIMFFLNLLTVLVLYMTLCRLRASWLVAAISTAIFCVHSTFIDLQMNGLETSLNTLMLLMLFNGFLTVYLQPCSPHKRYIYFGFMSAAIFLTRTDNAIALLVLFSVLLWNSRKEILLCRQKVLLAAAVAFFLVLPWLVWNQINFGSLVQGSGKIETIYWGEPHFSWINTAYNAIVSPLRIYDCLKIFTRLFVAPAVSTQWITLLFIVGWAIVVLLLLSPRNKQPSLQALAIFCVAVFFVFAYNAGFRNFTRMWYYIPVGLVALLAMAGFAAWIERSCKPWGRQYSVVLLLMWFGSVLWLHSPTKLPDKADELSPNFIVAEWINSNTPSNAVVGSMNSGILGYLVHRKVVNLDGVVDARSMRAHWEKRQAAYIHERGIQYLVDNDGARAFFCNENPFHTCQPVFTFGDSRNSNKVVQIVDKPR